MTWKFKNHQLCNVINKFSKRRSPQEKKRKPNPIPTYIRPKRKHLLHEEGQPFCPSPCIPRTRSARLKRFRRGKSQRERSSRHARLCSLREEERGSDRGREREGARERERVGWSRVGERRGRALWARGGRGDVGAAAPSGRPRIPDRSPP